MVTGGELREIILGAALVPGVELDPDAVAAAVVDDVEDDELRELLRVALAELTPFVVGDFWRWNDELQRGSRLVRWLRRG